MTVLRRIFQTPPSPLPPVHQILRCVQKWRVNKVVVHLAGIELDRARQTGSTRNGDFRGIKVLDCPAGRGFICEEVRRT